MEVRLFPNSARPGIGLTPRRESQRPLLPQHARHCPVLEAGSDLGFLVYPPLEPYESFYVGHYGEGRYQFVYYFRTPKGEWSPVFTVKSHFQANSSQSLRLSGLAHQNARLLTILASRPESQLVRLRNVPILVDLHS